MAFARAAAEGTNVLVANARGRVLRKLSGYGPLNEDPAWSPDGRQVAFVTGWHGSLLVVVDRQGGAPREVVRSEDFVTFFRSPSWSPDGTRLAFHGGFKERYGIYTVRRDGSERRLVVPNSGDDPDWSPDGAQLAYSRLVDGRMAIFIANANGTKERRLTSSPSENERAPAWSPDGKLIAFERGSSSGTRIVVVRSDTGQQVGGIKRSSGVAEPSWRPPAPLPKAKRRPC